MKTWLTVVALILCVVVPNGSVAAADLFTPPLGNLEVFQCMAMNVSKKDRDVVVDIIDVITGSVMSGFTVVATLAPLEGVQTSAVGSSLCLTCSCRIRVKGGAKTVRGSATSRSVFAPHTVATSVAATR